MVGVQNIKAAFKMFQPVANEIFRLIHVEYCIDIIFLASLSGGGSAAIPDDTCRVDPGDEEREGVVLNIIRDMAIGFVAATHNQQMCISNRKNETNPLM